MIVEAEVGDGDHPGSVGSRFEELGEDADEVARFLGLGGDEELVFEELEQVEGEGPSLGEALAGGLVFAGRDVAMLEIGGEVDV